MYNGDIIGEYVNLKENEAIEMKWKLKEWTEFKDLLVTFENFNNSCAIIVNYSDISDQDSFRTLWIEDIFKKISTVFGYHLRTN